MNGNSSYIQWRIQEFSKEEIWIDRYLIENVIQTGIKKGPCMDYTMTQIDHVSSIDSWIHIYV